MTLQQQKEIKQAINKQFGFDTKKIIVLEYGGKNVFDEHSYIMFEVCGIQYQMRWNVLKDYYTLNIYNDGLTVDIIQ